IMFSLNLTSINGYYGGVSLTSQFLNSSLSNPPTLSLGQNSLQVPSGGSVQGTLTFSTSASTVLGLYLFSDIASPFQRHPHPDYIRNQLDANRLSILLHSPWRLLRDRRRDQRNTAAQR